MDAAESSMMETSMSLSELQSIAREGGNLEVSAARVDTNGLRMLARDCKDAGTTLTIRDCGQASTTSLRGIAREHPRGVTFSF